MKVAYFDCFSGAGGDMIVASLVDAGAGADDLRKGLASIPVSGYALTIEKVQKQGFAATRFHVELDARDRQPHRHLDDVVEIVRQSALSAGVKQSTARIFQRLAEAEARVHGISVEEVHFHEVGAVDAILDVAGAALALELLGVDRVICSPIPVGSGTVSCDHGLLPVPAPATAELLKGVPISTTDEVGELTTPTAAAVLTTLAGEFGPLPSMTVSAVGYGAGAREGRTRANLLRVMTGELVAGDDADADEVTILETNLDDASPQLVGYCIERLLDEGALDAYMVPIQMKKARGGVVLTVLCTRQQVPAMERILFAETPTFGVRRHLVARTKMRRRHEVVRTPYGDIRVKIGEHERAVTANPEYEDCRAAAQKHGVALREVMAVARAAWTGGKGVRKPPDPPGE